MFGLLSLIVLIVVAVLGYIVTRLQKRRMRNALGREVGDHDLSSINSWMKVSEAEERQSGEKL